MKLGTLRVPNLFGAGDEARTRYLHLGKVALYQMSYTRILAPRMEPRRWPSEANSFDSKVELWKMVPPVGIEPTTRGFSVLCSTYWATEAYEEEASSYRKCDIKMATRNGLEPSTSSVTGWRANRLHHRAKWYGGNNRARTCDLLLVRQMLSQLSYAPFCSPPRVSLNDGVHYTRKPPICQAIFAIFFNTVLCLILNYEKII